MLAASSAQSRSPRGSHRVHPQDPSTASPHRSPTCASPVHTIAPSVLTQGRACLDDGSGGEIRTRDLRVMSAFSPSTNNPLTDSLLHTTVRAHEPYTTAYLVSTFARFAVLITVEGQYGDTQRPSRRHPEGWGERTAVETSLVFDHPPPCPIAPRTAVTISSASGHGTRRSFLSNPPFRAQTTRPSTSTSNCPRRWLCSTPTSHSSTSWIRTAKLAARSPWPQDSQ